MYPAPSESKHNYTVRVDQYMRITVCFKLHRTSLILQTAEPDDQTHSMILIL